MTRHNEPIGNVRVKHAVDPDIDYSIEFLGWQAAIAANANLDQLLKWDNGEYPRVFMARVIAWYELHSMVEAHQEDASMGKEK